MFLDRWFKPVWYVRVGPQRVRLRAPARGPGLDEPALIAIVNEGKRKLIAAFGNEAARMRGREKALVLAPFEHPRIVVGDFTLAEQLLKGLGRRMATSAWFRPMPTVVIQADREFEGGLSEIEIRVLQELAMGGLGASRAIVWEGPALTDEQLLRLDFPTTGEVLLDSAARRPPR